jgi:hypothetical protein
MAPLKMSRSPDHNYKEGILKLRTTFAIGACAVFGAAALAACGGDDTNGGSAGSAGTSTGSGGTPGSGGTTGSGGTAGTGGTTGTGGTAGAGGGTVSDASIEAGCTCTGAACTPAGVLYSFDPGADAGATTGWSSFVADSADSGLTAGTVIGSSTAEGHTALGSLEVTVPFSSFGAMEAVSIQHNFGDSPGRGALDWSCKTKLHVWVKVAAPDAGSITGTVNGIQVYVQSGNVPDDAGFHGYERYSPLFVNGSVFADGAFHEVVVDLTAAGTAATMVNLTDINQIGVQVLGLAMPAEGGPATPSPVTLFIDDVSLE